MLSDRYAVNEIFETIQGEATWTGTPSLFVRLQGCPVGCVWCDTKHTWDVKPEMERPLVAIGEKTAVANAHWSTASADELIERMRAARARHVVLTGGEPCLYDLTPFATHRIGKAVQVETSGTHVIRASPDAWVTVSPKVGMAGGLVVLHSALVRADEIKFPVGRKRDIDTLQREVLPFLKPNVPVWLQPLSMSPAATDYCVEAATEHGWRVSVQTHRFLGLR